MIGWSARWSPCRCAAEERRASTTTASPPCSPACPSDSPIRPVAWQRIRAEMDGVKQSKQAVAGDVLTSLSGFAPPGLLALGSRLVTLSPRLNMHTATTNVPGPQEPVQTLGRRHARVIPIRARGRLDPNRRGDLLLRRRALLWRHRRLRRRTRYRRPDRRHQAGDDRPARAPAPAAACSPQRSQADRRTHPGRRAGAG